MALRTYLVAAGRRGRLPLAARLLVCAMALCVPPARADVDIDVHGVPDNIRSNVLAYLSLQRYQHSKDLSVDTIERLHARVEREVRSALKPFGYYEPVVNSDIRHSGEHDWKVAIEIDPGPAVLVSGVDVQVHGPGATDPLFTRILSALPVHPGERLSHGAYEALKADLQRTAATYGYLDARLTRNEMLVDLPAHTARIALEMQSGERYRFGPTQIEQRVVDDVLVRRYLRYRENEDFDLTQILRTQFALDDTAYFANLEVLPGEPDREHHLVPVSIHADPNRRNRYSIGAGYATDTGPRGTVTWENRRLNTRGHRFSVTAEASQRERYALQTQYVVPFGDPAVENLALLGRVEQLQLGAVQTRTQSFGPRITALGGNWQHVWFANAMRTVTTDAAEAGGQRTDRLLVPGVDLASVPKDYLGEPIFQHPFFLELRGSANALGADARFLQLRVQAERVFRIAPLWHLLLRDEIGTTLVSRFEAVPGALRFFAGGDNSVRGFAFDDLAPLSCAPGHTLAPGQCASGYGARTGGKHLITGTVEVIRDLPRNFGIATFFDYGNAFNHFGDPLEYSVGVGVRLRLPVVTLGVDIAEPLSRAGASPRLHINFSPKL